MRRIRAPNRERHEANEWSGDGSSPLPRRKLGQRHAEGHEFHGFPRMGLEDESGDNGGFGGTIVFDRDSGGCLANAMRVDGFAETNQPFRCAFRGRHPDKILWQADGFWALPSSP